MKYLSNMLISLYSYPNQCTTISHFCHLLPSSTKLTPFAILLLSLYHSFISSNIILVTIYTPLPPPPIHPVYLFLQSVDTWYSTTCIMYPSQCSLLWWKGLVYGSGTTCGHSGHGFTQLSYISSPPLLSWVVFITPPFMLFMFR